MNIEDYRKLSDLGKLNHAKEIYLKYISWGYSDADSMKEAMKNHSGGCDRGEYGYPVMLFSGKYILLAQYGSARIYKEIS